MICAALARALSETPRPRDIGKPRLPVDRVFKLQGIGTVITGTLTGGTLRRGQNVAIQPSGKAARIRSIQSHGRDVEASVPGTRTALNLSLDAVEDIHRGDVITSGESGSPSRIVDVLFEISPRANRPVKDVSRVHAHYGSGSAAARLVFYSGEQLPAGGRGLAQLRLEAPAFVFAGDRFIVRDWAETHTLGGATVDPQGNQRLFRSKARRLFLETRAAAPGDVEKLAVSQIVLDGAVRKAQLLLKSRFSAADIAEAISRAAAAGNVSRAPENSL